MRTAVLTATVCLVAASLAACGSGSDSDTADDPAPFCAALAQLDAVESDGDEFVDSLARLDSVAPADIADATGELLAFIEASNSIGMLDGDERTTAIDELTAREGDFDAAVASLGNYSLANCPELGDELSGVGS